MQFDQEGVLIKTLFGLIECGGVKVSSQASQNLKLSECHELKIIEWLAWALAIVAVITAVPVAFGWIHKRKEDHKRKQKNDMTEKV